MDEQPRPDVLPITGRSPRKTISEESIVNSRRLELPERPRPEWVRGKCPDCGDDLVSNCYYIGGKGYIICWDCWSSLKKPATCRYRKVI